MCLTLRLFLFPRTYGDEVLPGYYCFFQADFPFKLSAFHFCQLKFQILLSHFVLPWNKIWRVSCASFQQFQSATTGMKEKLARDIKKNVAHKLQTPSEIQQNVLFQFFHFSLLVKFSFTKYCSSVQSNRHIVFLEQRNNFFKTESILTRDVKTQRFKIFQKYQNGSRHGIWLPLVELKLSILCIHDFLHPPQRLFRLSRVGAGELLFRSFRKTLLQ